MLDRENTEVPISFKLRNSIIVCNSSDISLSKVSHKCNQLDSIIKVMKLTKRKVGLVGIVSV